MPFPRPASRPARTRRVGLALAGLLALALAACSTGPAASPADGASPSGATGADASPSAAATRVEVSLTDALRIEPAEITVPAGVPVTFVVTNTGATLHEFILGDEAEQQAHEEEMAGGHDMGGEENGAEVPPGETKELVHTFETPGTTLAGCHVAGHYGAGMRATITIR